MFQLRLLRLDTCFIWCPFGWRGVDFPVGEKEAKAVSEYAFDS